MSLKNFSFFFSDLIIKIITFDSFIVKKIIKDFLKKYQPKSVLDLGCGSGSLSSLFRKESYLGFDIDEDLIEYAKSIHPGYKFLNLSSTNFYLNQKFEMILIVGVLHHLNNLDTDKTLSLTKKHLKKNGHILIIEAIWPIFKINLIGKFLRMIDKGNFIRTTDRYQKMVVRHFKIISCNSTLGGLIDYAVIVAA